MIRSVKLKNWKSHRSSEFKFDAGTNMLVGAMGAGKSSILQAITFALFGTFAELKRRDLKISEIISRGASPAVAEVHVELKTPSGKTLLITRRVNEAKASTEAIVRDGEGNLQAGPSPTAANDFIKDALQVDEDVFLRTVYAMQNEIDLILRMGPGERKQRIDELMGLHKFEVARKSCVALRNKINVELQAIRKLLAETKVDDLNKLTNSLRSDISNIENRMSSAREEVGKKQTARDNTKISVEALRDKIKELERLRERALQLDRQLIDINTKLEGKDLSRSLQELDTESERLREQVTALQGKKLAVSEALRLDREKILQIEKERGILEEKVRELKDRLSRLAAVKSQIEELKSKHGFVDLTKEIADLKASINTKEFRQKDNQAEMNSLRKHLEDLEMFDSTCPTCLQQLSEASRNKLISDKKRQIAQLLYDNNKITEELNELRSKFNKLESAFEDNKKYIDDLAQETQLVKDLQSSAAKLTKNNFDKVALQEGIQDKEKILRKTDVDLESISTRQNEISETRHLYELKDKRAQLTSELASLRDRAKDQKEIELLKKEEGQLQDLIRRVQELETRLKSDVVLLKEKQDRFKEVDAKKRQMQNMQEKVAKFKKQIEFLSLFKNALQATQLALRDDLILAVNEVMSSVWSEIYPYEIWSGVRLAISENDYHLQLKQTEGEWVSVAGFASGGERMLASLAVRIAFARVLSPNLSMLILDEPTHNLDEKAIATFIDVIQNRVSDFLDQIFIVTHDEKLAESADKIIRIA